MDSGNRIVRIGVIGAGRVAEIYHLPVLAKMPDARLTWICDLDKTRALKLARRYRIREVQQAIANCSDVDIVLVGMPVGFRDGVLEQVFARKWHALVEKPFATSSDQHDRILGHAAESGVQVGVGFQRRMYNSTMLAQQIVARALFGPIKQIWATEGMRLGSSGPGNTPWSTDRKMAGGGVLTETACHIIDQLFTICAYPDWQLDRCDLCYLPNIEFEAKLAGTLALGNGQRCKFGIAVSWLGDLYNAIVIEFADAQLKIPIRDEGLQIVDTHGNSIGRVEDLVSNSGAGSAFQCYYDEWREFIGQTISRQPSRLTADTARSTTKLIEECYRQQPPPVMD